MSDEAYVFIVGCCFACQQPFTFHPNLVPSIRHQGTREPVCRGCIERANVERAAKGLPALEILPGAYEPAPESSINWGD